MNLPLLDRSSGVEDANNNKPRSFQISIYLLIATITSVMPNFMLGYHMLAMSPALLSLQVDYDYSLTALQGQLLVSSLVCTGLIGTLLGGQINDLLGRRYTIFISLIMFSIGGVAMAAAPNRPYGWILILIGRCIAGVGSGLAYVGGSVYLAECSPKHIRGRFLFLVGVAISFGNLTAGIFCFGFSYLEHFWRYIFGVSAVLPLIGIVSCAFLPESPRWLIRKRKNEKARESLKKLRGKSITDSQIDEELNDILTDLENLSISNRNNVISSLWGIISQRHMLCALIVGCGVGLLPIVSGTGITLYYSAMIVKMSGLASVNASIGFLIIVSIVKLLFNFVGLFLVEKLGRRLLTFISLSGMIVSLLLLAVSFYLADLTSKPSCPTDVCFHNSCEECVTQNSCLFCLLPSNSSYSDANSIGYCINHFNSTNDNGECFISESQQLSNVHDKACNAFNDTYSLEINGFYKGSTYSSCPNKYFGLALTSYIIYIITFASGISALPWIIISEIYPNWARSIASSIAFTVYMFGLLISTITFIFISEYLTHFGVFMLYMCLSVTGWIFVLLFLPETKGRSLEDTESLFKSSICPPPGLRKDLKQLVVT